MADTQTVAEILRERTGEWEEWVSEESERSEWGEWEDSEREKREKSEREKREKSERKIVEKAPVERKDEEDIRGKKGKNTSESWKKVNKGIGRKGVKGGKKMVGKKEREGK